MERAGFERLDVYRRAYRAALDVHRLSLRLPEIERFVLADQMRRASRSVVANIAEGYGRRRMSAAEYRRFLTMATGSADEMRVWACFARDLGYIEASEADALAAEYAEIAAMTQGLARAWAEGRAR